MIPTAHRFFTSPVEALSAEEEAAFFTALRNGNATFKRTEAGRFHRVNQVLVNHIGSASIGEVLDVGISSGVTTLELVQALTNAGHRPNVTGTDYVLDAFIVPVARGCRALVDSHGHLLQLDLFGHAVRPWQRRLDWLTGMVLLRPVLASAGGALARSALARGSKQPVQLVSPRLASGNDVALVRDDVTRTNEAFKERFDLIRAANILNRDYFEEWVLRRAIANLVAYMSGPGAYLLLIRTIGDGTQHGTLFRMNSNRKLEVVERFGEGSEVEGLTC